MPAVDPAAILYAALLAKADGDDDTARDLGELIGDPEQAEVLAEGEVVAKAFRKASVHAPAGGVTVGGKEYKGGEFIPGDVMDKATDEEREAVEGGDTRPKKTPASNDLEKRLPIDGKAAANFWRTGDAAAFRIHDARSPLPERSRDMWTDDDESDEPRFMDGVSGYPNMSNVLEDLLYGINESVTGENYSKNIITEGGEPVIVVMSGSTRDAPGAEVLVKSPKIAAVITRSDIEPPFRAEAKRIISEIGDPSADANDADTLSPEELADKYGFDANDFRRIEGRIFSHLKAKNAK